jgi:hypothetical protein
MPAAKRKLRTTLPRLLSRKRAKREQLVATKAAAAEAREQKQREEGDHVKVLAPKAAVVRLIDTIISAKSQTSEIGQRVSAESQRAGEAGVDIPGTRMAARVINKAKQDPMKGRMLHEQYLYALECYGFDRVAPPLMFSMEESGLGAKGKKKEPEVQLDLEPAANGGGEAQVMPGDVGPMMQ